MKINSDINLWTQPFAQHLHGGDSAFDLGMSFDPLVVTGNAALETRNPLADGILTQASKLLPRLSARVIVSPHPARIHRAAQKFVNRKSEHLSSNVPQRLVDS